jgi:uncharacterized protein YjbJ (UPF0337 family)
MEKLKLQAPWEQVKERLKENDVHLSDEDLDYIPGQEDKLLERLKGKLGKNKEEIRAYIESISANDDAAG